MLKLFIGGKGSGKTKALIDLVNKAASESKGSVVCIEKGDKLTLDVSYKARLIDADGYSISSTDELYGFITGILASNNDITDLFVDSSLKICGGDANAFGTMLAKLEAKLEGVNVVMTASIPVEECPESVKKFA